MISHKGKLAVSRSPMSAPHPVSTGGEEEPLGDGDQEADILHRLCPTYASDINSPLRHVRTRIYFTSESHIHSLLNVLRFCHLRPGCPGSSDLVNPEGQDLLDHTPEFDYLTHIVIRMYENKQVPVHAPERFRVEVAFSPGAAFNPVEVRPKNEDHALGVAPRVVLNQGTVETLSEMEELLVPLAKARKVLPSPYALQVALKAPSNATSEASSKRASISNLAAHGAAAATAHTAVCQAAAAAGPLSTTPATTTATAAATPAESTAAAGAGASSPPAVSPKLL